MEISEVRIKLLPESDGMDKLRGFCSITIDDEFVIRDLKIIEGARGAFIAMPSRKLTDRCSRCRQKNHYRAKFCNECGAQLRRQPVGRDDGGRVRLYVDVAHPIHSTARRKIHARIMEAYRSEVERARRGDYVFASFDDEGFDETYDEVGFGDSETGAIEGHGESSGHGSPSQLRAEEGREGGCEADS